MDGKQTLKIVTATTSFPLRRSSLVVHPLTSTDYSIHCWNTPLTIPSTVETHPTCSFGRLMRKSWGLKGTQQRKVGTFFSNLAMDHGALKTWNHKNMFVGNSVCSMGKSAPCHLALLTKTWVRFLIMFLYSHFCAFWWLCGSLQLIQIHSPVLAPCWNRFHCWESEYNLMSWGSQRRITWQSIDTLKKNILWVITHPVVVSQNI